MKRFQQPLFETAELADVTAFATSFKQADCAFVSITATTCDDGCELLYVFRPRERASELHGKTIFVREGDVVASITPIYPEAFVFENESHDLFGIEFDGISIDYEGDFYKVAVAYPMNPRAAVSGQAPEQPGESREGGQSHE